MATACPRVYTSASFTGGMLPERLTGGDLSCNWGYPSPRWRLRQSAQRARARYFGEAIFGSAAARWGSRWVQLPASSTDASFPFPSLGHLRGVALAADPHIVTVPDQPPAQAPAPPPAPVLPQPPIPALGHKPEAPPGAGQSGTEQSPWFVRILPTPKTAEEAEAENREQEARAANERV
jgi:hypothetical protein